MIHSQSIDLFAHVDLPGHDRDCQSGLPRNGQGWLEGPTLGGIYMAVPWVVSGLVNLLPHSPLASVKTGPSCLVPPSTRSGLDTCNCELLSDAHSGWTTRQGTLKTRQNPQAIQSFHPFCGREWVSPCFPMEQMENGEAACSRKTARLRRRTRNHEGTPPAGRRTQDPKARPPEKSVLHL